MGVFMLKRILPIILLCLILVSCGKPAVDTIFAMDTVMQFTIYGENADETISAIRELVREYELTFSPTRKDSELFKLNESKTAALSPLFCDVLSQSISLSKKTNGAFDPVLGSAIDLWSNKQIPDKTELEAASFGISNMVLNGNVCTLSDEASVNLGAIVKGAVSDAIYNLLSENGIKSALCPLGGNILAFGTRTDGTPWNIGIRDPNGEATDYLGTVAVCDKFVIASGDYERFFEKDGVRYHHILDPKTGAPATNDLRSVTIIADKGAMADAYSTALFVMGSKDALSFWENQDNFEMILVLKDNSVIVTDGLDFKLTNEEYTYEIAHR